MGAGSSGRWRPLGLRADPSCREHRRGRGAGALTLGPDGETAPVYSYTDAIRERVFVPVAGVDQDGDGVTDRVAIDIMRPGGDGAGPEGAGDHRRRARTTRRSAAATRRSSSTRRRRRPDRFPLFYDNYFVPRGYAVVLAEADRHGLLDRLPAARRARRHRRRQGRHRLAQGPRPGLRRRRRQPRHAPTGTTARAAMIGKSYDGTLANGVAATGVDGPDDDRPDLGDLRLVRLLALERHPPERGTHYPAFLSSAITHNQNAATLGVVPPEPTRRACAARERHERRRRRRDRRHQPVLARPQLQHERRQRPARCSRRTG